MIASWKMKYNVYTQLPEFSWLPPCLRIWLMLLKKLCFATEVVELPGTKRGNVETYTQAKMNVRTY
jgi:hypothetical protein